MYQVSLAAQSCPTLCDPVNRSTPGLPVHHQLLEYTYMYIFSHIFYCCYKPLPLCWVFAVLWSFPVFLFFPLFFLLLFLFFLFFIILIFNFFKPIIFFSIFIPLFAFPTVFFPLQLIFNVYKSSSTSI